MKVRIRAALVSMIAALALFGGAGAARVSQTFAQDATPTATPVTTGNVDILAISPALCFLLTAARDQTFGPSCDGFDSLPAQLHAIADFMGDDDGVVEPDDFAGMDLDGNQVHQMDDWLVAPGASRNGSLWIMVWVPNQAPVTFKTNVGVFVPAGSVAPGDPHPLIDDVSQTWVCDNLKGAAANVLLEDADCGPGFGAGDGVVVARLRPRYGASIADLGPGRVSVHQAITDNGTIQFTVVGEPRQLEFVTLETTIQTGITDPDADCPLPGGASGFLDANATPQRSIVLARARDLEGNSVTGAMVNWSTDDPDIAVMAAPLTPTLDLGSFGFGAPNIICGTKEPGTVEVTAEGGPTGLVGTSLLTVDPQATESIEKITFKVVGDPASISATAAPSAIACDGTQTSTVTATVLDAAGTPITAGNEVHFDVQVLGTANPINAKTNGEGVATSTITPLAIGSTGVPVTVSIGDVATSVRIDCTGAAPPPPPGPGTAPPGGGGQGVISGPDTGMGVGASAPAGVSAWAYALLALGAVTLSAGSVLAAGRTKNR